MSSLANLNRGVEFLQRTLIVWLLISSYVAFRWAEWFPQQAGLFRETIAGWHLNLSIAVTMFAIGLMLPRDEVRLVLRRWPLILAGTTVQYTAMPLLAYCGARLAGLGQTDLIGVVLVGCVPGAMASNVLTANAGGNTSYSVGLTTTATVLSPLAVPLALGLTLVQSGTVAQSILLRSSGLLMVTVVAPVLAGYWIGSRQRAEVQAWLRPLGAIVANLVILFIIAVVVGKNRSTLEAVRGDLLVVLLVINMGGYVAGYAAAWGLRLPESMRRALTLEIGMQNAGLGATLALSLFPDQPAVAIAPAAYTFGCMLTGTILASMWRMWWPLETTAL